MTVKLYVYPGENIRVDKTDALTQPVIFNADTGFEGNQNIEAPSVIIKSQSEPLYNYAFIDVYNRYYYITGKTWLSNDLWRLSMIVDPLMSFKNNIYNQEGIILYSGKGNSKKLDHRIIYNLPPLVEALNNQSGITHEKGYFVLGCRFTPPKSDVNITNATSQMTYLVMSYQGYTQFLLKFMMRPDADRVALSKAFVSCSLVYWFDGTGLTTDYWTSQAITYGYQRYAYFRTPETDLWDPDEPYKLDLASDIEPTNLNEWYQIDDNTPLKRKYVYFKEHIGSYADRRAERVLDLPYIGKINLDLDNLGIDIGADDIYIGVEIGYDFGGNNYVVTPFYQIMERPTDPFSLAHCTFRRDAYTVIPNGYFTSFITDESFQNIEQTNTRNAIGIFSGLYNMGVNAASTEGASLIRDIPNALVRYSDRVMQLDYLKYQQGASLNASGSGNGGSIYNAFIGKSGNVITKPETKLFKKTNRTSADLTNFVLAYGKPDGAFRQLNSLKDTGFCQMGMLQLKEFTNATNNEKTQIKDALLSGVIL